MRVYIINDDQEQPKQFEESFDIPDLTSKEILKLEQIIIELAHYFIYKTVKERFFK